MATDLILIRHGETDWNRAMRFQGHSDVPLDAVGAAQAERLAERLAGEAVDHAVASDLVRTRQTAAPAVARLGLALALALDTDAGLREQFFGEAEGLTAAELRERMPASWLRWLDFQAEAVCPAARARACSTPAASPRCAAWRFRTRAGRCWW